MPVVLGWEGHRFLFYSREIGEPPHVHVLKDRKQLKVWLRDIRVARNAGFGTHEINAILRVVAEHKDSFWRLGLTILEIDERHLLVSAVDVTGEYIAFTMADGRRIEAPLWWYPRLQAASTEQRQRWEILPFGDAVGWEEVDEYISAKALIVGGPAPGAVQPAQAAE